MDFGSHYNGFDCDPLELSNNHLNFVNQWKYLGVNVISSKFYLAAHLKVLLDLFIDAQTQF